jgi:hypothetical protein
VILAFVVAGACSRDPVEVPCPDVVAGDLVVTEIRGAQSPEPGYGEWIELYNRSASDIDLTGLRVSLTRLVDGTAAASFILRGGASTGVAAGGYFVLGRFPPGEEPDHVQYGYAADYDGELPSGAAVDVHACGELIDRMIYRSLPGEGTYSLSGAIDPPEGGENDTEDAWCVDLTEDDDTPTMGIRGTPGRKNIPCA